MMRKNKNYWLLLAICVPFLLESCSDLEIEETDSIIVNQTGEFTGVGDVDGTLSGIYDAVRGQLETQENLYGMVEVSSDEFVVPTRGTDWGDNGVWRTLHQHSWSPIHSFVRNVWNDQNSIVFRTTEVIDERSAPSPSQEAEARFLRAWAMFWVMDLYGQVPFRGPDEGIDVDPMVMTRSEAFDFIMNDLTIAAGNLSAISPGNGINKANKAAVHYLLAKMYLNKHIYTGTGSPAAEDMQSVIENVDAITAMGFALEEGYFGIFSPNTDTETIWHTNSGIGNLIWHTLHYNQTTPANGGGGWNGFTTLSEFYDLFEGDPQSNPMGGSQEERRGFVPTSGVANNSVDYDGDGEIDDLDEDSDGMLDGSQIGFGMLIGQQYGIDGSELQAEAGRPLEFTKELPGLLGNPQASGVRVIKYHPSNGSYTGHKIIFRYADAYLMKAEAMMNNGEDVTDMVNDLREIRNASPLGSVTADDLLAERGRELYSEYWRRNDLIRFGKFTEAWEFKNASEDFRTLFPIPASAIISNPNLTQNPGY